MRPLILAFLMLVGAAPPAWAQLSIGFGVRTADVSVSINLPVYPDLVLIPGYPVYYAPGLSVNFFFYDGYYWLFEDGYWYVSPWYNGPWDWVAPIDVPVFLLRVPIRYYRVVPPAFAHWHRHQPPRWGAYWGPQWERHRYGWQRWNRRDIPAPAPLPLYQRSYGGERYPRFEQQQQLRREYYRHQPSESLVRDRFENPGWRQERGASRPMPPGLEQRPDAGRYDTPEPPTTRDPGRLPPGATMPRQDEPQAPATYSSPPRESEQRETQQPEFQRPEMPQGSVPQRSHPSRDDPPAAVQPRGYSRESPGMSNGRGGSQGRDWGQERRGPPERGR